MVGRRLREHELTAGTVQLKLRYTDFSTITRAHTMERATALDTELLDEIRALFRRNWKAGARGAVAGRARFRLAGRSRRNWICSTIRGTSGGSARLAAADLHARPLRRFRRLAGRQPARQVPRARPRNPAGHAR
jgi:hypothetical protein